MGGQRKRLKELGDYAESLGFRPAGRTGKGHPKVKHPNGATMIFSLTPSAPSADRNAKAMLKRLASAEGGRER